MLKCETCTYVVTPTDGLRLDVGDKECLQEWGGGRLGNDTSEYRRGDKINTLG